MVTSAVSGAFAQAGLPFPETEFASACFGFAGGRGHAFGAEGGAWGIVREALRASFRYHEDWGPHTGDPNIHALRMRFYTNDYPQERVASLDRWIRQPRAATPLPLDSGSRR